MPRRQRLHALDAIFLPMETSIQSLHVGSVLVLEGVPPDPGAFRDHVAAAVAQVPCLGWRAMPIPLDLGRPLWVDAPESDPADRVHHVTLDGPGEAGDDELRALVCEVMGRRLDPDQPLWELWQVDGLAGGRWAVVAKAHHTMVDGQSGSDLVAALLTDTPPPAGSPRPPTGGDSQPPPTRRALVADLLRWLCLLPLRSLRLLLRSALHPRAAGRRAAQVRFGLRQVLVPDLPPSVLTGPLGAQRSWGWTSIDLTPLARAAEGAGATVNDLYLAALAGGLRRFLLGRGEPVDSVVVRAIVPVSGRPSQQHAARQSGRPLRPGNLASAMFVVLPVDLDSTVARLAAVSARTAEQKARGVPAATAAVVRMADHIPAVLLARGARAYGRSGQGRVNLVASNVRGPATEQHLLGSRLVELIPWVPTAEEVRVSTAMVTCNGRMTIGITADATALPDVDDLIAAVAQELTALAATHGAGSRSGTRRANRKSTPSPTPL
ncbi:diacylglycerol O-acyltransferase [Humibacillus xanthopallidus]|uniref:Diacylglycerol O-acyltransferase n=1 Tax=Humibacillus xanthopallidus TaxID=412689 RepID=A0A543PKD5_9MICO|nr:wax ester/triacylglycerol synthase family O-acyltransferase [Humibacillus xanthopallidus]TQN44541.1 diacylglycerol O-acyltransferase [Humibacillus xanthopallidus]